MKRFFFASCLSAAIAAAWLTADRAPTPRVAPVPPKPSLMARYCLECHRPGGKEVDLTHADRELLQKAVFRISAHMMPPDKHPQPTPHEREQMAAEINATLRALDYRGPPDPGHVTMRRLNRVEYNNTIRDLIGLDLRPADDFPDDNVGYGFDNVGDVLTLPPVLMERYLTAAEKIVARLFAPTEPTVRRLEAAELDESVPTSVHGNQRVLYTNAEIFRDLTLPAGDYELRVSAEADQAGPEAARMSFIVGGVAANTVDVPARRGDAQVYTHRAKISGRSRVGVGFVNDFYRPKEKLDRNLVVNWIEIVGPAVVIPPEEEAARTRIAAEGVRGFASRAYRRPATDEEVARLEALGSIETAVTAVLVSPHFLFRVEEKLGAYELASRLSYFLWSSMPDEALRADAADGSLDLDAQVRRMLADPKAAALSENFVPQWLQIRRLETLTPDAKLFPQFGTSLKAAMMREPVMLFRAVLQEHRSVYELFNADFTFVNEELGNLYGIEVTGPILRRVKLTDPRRGGVLTMAAVLTASSQPARTSPTRRGKWVLEAILGTPPPPPLPDAGQLPDTEGAVSVRELLERHRANPACATCHQLMDPIGLSLENFDAIGRWRDVDGLPIDGPVELRKMLLERRGEIARNLVEKMLTYALGRGVEPYDGPTISAILETLERDPKLETLVLEVARSYPFRNTR